MLNGVKRDCFPSAIGNEKWMNGSSKPWFELVLQSAFYFSSKFACCRFISTHSFIRLLIHSFIHACMHVRYARNHTVDDRVAAIYLFVQPENFFPSSVSHPVIHSLSHELCNLILNLNWHVDLQQSLLMDSWVVWSVMWMACASDCASYIAWCRHAVLWSWIRIHLIFCSAKMCNFRFDLNVGFCPASTYQVSSFNLSIAHHVLASARLDRDDPSQQNSFPYVVDHLMLSLHFKYDFNWVYYTGALTRVVVMWDLALKESHYKQISCFTCSFRALYCITSLALDQDEMQDSFRSDSNVSSTTGWRVSEIPAHVWGVYTCQKWLQKVWFICSALRSICCDTHWALVHM